MGQVIVGSGDMLFYGGAWNGTVDYYADLPDATTHEGQIWAVLNSSGIYGINYKSAGLYISNGTIWNIYSAFDSFQITAVSPLSYNENTSQITTSISTDKLVGRYSSGTGVMQEVGLGTGISFSGGNLEVNVSTALGYTPEDVANKATDFSTINNTLYPSVQAVNTKLSEYVPFESRNYQATLSSGVHEGLEVTINSDPAKIDIAAGTYTLVDDWTDPQNPITYDVSYAGATGVTVTNLATADFSYILLDTAGSVVQLTSPPTGTQHRNHISLAQLGHTNRTSVASVNSIIEVFASPIEQMRDQWEFLGILNKGNVISPNGTNLSINKSSGELFSQGSNFYNDNTDPHVISIGGYSPATLRRRTQTGNGATGVTTIDPANYDVAGTITSMSGTKYTNQRVFLFPNGNIVVQYGQTQYNNMAQAIAAISTESFTPFPNVDGNAAFIAVITVRNTATDLSDTAQCIITKIDSRTGFPSGSSGTATTTLQQAYENSNANPEIETTSTGGAVTVRTYSGGDATNALEVQNNAGTTNFSVTGNGLITGTTTTQSANDNSTKLASTAYVDTGISAKVAKVAMTDDALVRADGTTGDIQGSGVIIDDSDNINSSGGFYSLKTFSLVINPIISSETVAESLIKNLRTTSSGHAYQKKQVTANGADAYDWWTDGTINYTAGLDGTDGKWKLSNSSSLGTTDVLEFDGINGKFYGTVNLDSLTASTTLGLDGSKNIISITNTGSGNNVLATSPTLITPNIGAATGTSLVTTGNITSGNIIKSLKSQPGSTSQVTAQHSDNTDGNSNAQVSIITGGASGGDPILSWSNQVAGSTVTAFIDNTDNDIFKLQRNGSSFIESDLDGILSYPLQPAFEAHLSATVPNVTGDGTVYTIIFDTEIDDQSGGYDPTTGIFTAQEDGYYLFTFGAIASGLTAANNRLDINLACTSYTYGESIYDPRNMIISTFARTGQYGHIVKMLAGDTARINIRAYNNASKNVGVYTSATKWTTFSGFKLG